MPETMSPPAVGTRIANIPLLDADGATSSLADELAGRAAVVFFMRAADCPVCLAHARTLGRMIAAGSLGGVAVYVIAPGDSSRARLARQRITSPDIEVRASGDHHGDLGLGKFLTLQHSGTFVVDAGGRILTVRTSPLPTASFSEKEVLASLSRG